MNDDALLLRRYAEEGSEAAFTELVRRRVDLVYGAALRRTGGDQHRAADVAQQVFIQLARRARKLSGHPVLSAWLHTATRNAALNLMISEQRRQHREAEALALQPAGDTGAAEPGWEQLRPLLDTAIDELPEADRAAVVLRFLERRPFAEIGAALQVSEDAARMRTERALDKLRAALARRGIQSTATALGALVASQPLLSAPAGLTAVLAAQSLSAAAATFMTIKLITTAALIAFVAFGTGKYLGSHPADLAPSPRTEDPAHLQAIDALRQDNRRLQAEVAGLNADITRLNEAAAQLAAPRPAPAATAQPVPAQKSPTIGMSRGELQQTVLTNLRQIDAARKQFLHDNGRPPDSVRDLVGLKGYIRVVRSVGGEDYSALSMADAALLTVTTPDGISVTYDPSGTMTTRPELTPEFLQLQHLQELGQRLQEPIDKAVKAFRAANNGGNPANEQALLPYFATPAEGADFLELVEAQKAANR